MLTQNQNRNFDSIYKPAGPQIVVRHINNPGNKPPPPPGKPRRRLFKGLAITLLLLVLLAIAAIGVKSLALSNKVFVGQKRNIFQQVTDVIRGSSGHLSLLGEKEGQINILLLGIGGEGHDGPYLSDTIMLAQIKPEEQVVSLTSVPRDYWLDVKNIGYRKINAAFAEGFSKHKNWDEAGRAARDAVGKLSGLTIPYFAVIDFRGFEKAIDQVGGIDVGIDRTFTDYKYPNETNGYLSPVTFTQGQEHMNGKRALIFARSRHAAGAEGSDFSRSVRQHKMLQAFKSKLTSLNILSDSGALTNLLDTFADHFHTNINAGEMVHLYQIGKDWGAENIVAASLDPETGLVCPKILEESGAYVLLPCGGKTNKDIETFFKNSFVLGKLSAEKSVIWIATQNPKSLAYRQTEQKLIDLGLTVWPITYTEVAPEQTVIYQVNSKPATTTFIKNLLNAREVTIPPPNVRVDTTRSDIIIVLGNNLKLDPVVTPPPPVTNPPPIQ